MPGILECAESTATTYEQGCLMPLASSATNYEHSCLMPGGSSEEIRKEILRISEKDFVGMSQTTDDSVSKMTDDSVSRDESVGARIARITGDRKLNARMMKNRESACRSYQRKKFRIVEQDKEIAALRAENAELKKACATGNGESALIESLRRENDALMAHNISFGEASIENEVMKHTIVALKNRVTALEISLRDIRIMNVIGGSVEDSTQMNEALMDSTQMNEALMDSTRKNTENEALKARVQKLEEENLDLRAMGERLQLAVSAGKAAIDSSRSIMDNLLSTLRITSKDLEDKKSWYNMWNASHSECTRLRLLVGKQ